MVNYFLCDRRFIIQSVFYDHCFTVYNWKHRNDSHWSFLFKSKRYYIYAVWILHGIFLFIPCSWKRKRRVYSWILPTRYLPITEACLNIGLSILFGYFWGLNGILYAQPIADVLSALITVFMAIPLHRSLAVAEQKMKITASIPCDRQ